MKKILALLLLATLGVAQAQQIPLKVWNTGDAVSQHPTTFSVWCPRGRIPGSMVILKNGAIIPTQCNILSRHNDGSVQHALLTSVLNIGAGAVQEYAAKSGRTPVPSILQGTEKPVWAFIRVVYGEQKWTRAVGFEISGGTQAVLPFPGAKPGHLLGGFATEIESVPLPLFQGGTVHPNLKVVFRFRYLWKQGWRTEVVLENCGAPSKIGEDDWREWLDFLPADVPYDSIDVFTSETNEWHTVCETDVLYDATRIVWRDKHQKVFGITDPEYLRQHGFLPNMTLVPLTQEQADARVERHMRGTVGPADLTQCLGVPNSNGPIYPGMPSTGDRADLGPVPMWAHWAIRSFGASTNAWNWMMAGEYNGVSTCNWHVRDSLDGIMGVPAWREKYGIRERREKVPLGKPKVTTDILHLPNLCYLGFLFTGDRFCEEGMSAIASHCLVRYPWMKPVPRYKTLWNRGHAWLQRTTMLVAKLLPDSHTRKQWLLETVGFNLDQDLAHIPRPMGNYSGGAYRGSARPVWPCSTYVSQWNFAWASASWGWIFMLYGDMRAKAAFDKAMQIYKDSWALDGQSYQGTIGPPLIWNRLCVFEYTFPVETYTPVITDDGTRWEHVDGSIADITALPETRWWKWVNESNDIDYTDYQNQNWPPLPQDGMEAVHWLPNLNRIPESVIGTGAVGDPVRAPSDGWLHYAGRWLWPMAADLGYQFMWDDPELQRINAELGVDYVRLR